MSRKICITGASKGIGKAEAEILYADHELYLQATSLDSFQDLGLPNAKLFACDFADLTQIDHFVHELKSQTDTLDVLVNNAGFMTIDSFQHFSETLMHRMITVNLEAQLLLTQKLLPLLLKSNNPQIVFMSSMSAKNRIVGESVYAATKAGIMQFAHVLRNELAGKVRVSTIHSWGVNTWNDEADAAILKPEHVAETLQFILSRERPFLVESIELGHESHWNGAKAPWSPEL
ncbi:MAG: SDR family oxidoreductase [Flavobacteriaceae bacterium]|nr:SDR family oxidoreductase [Flavobacteriaceae bacterium]